MQVDAELRAAELRAQRCERFGRDQRLEGRPEQRDQRREYRGCREQPAVLREGPGEGAIGRDAREEIPEAERPQDDEARSTQLVRPIGSSSCTIAPYTSTLSAAMRDQS